MPASAEEQARFELHGMGSPNVRKIVLMLEELEVPYDIKLVQVFHSEQFTPAFRALNPLSKAPVLVDRAVRPGGYPVFESGAILIYLAETFGKFMPASGVERYEVLKWLFAQTSNVGPMFGQYTHFRTPGRDNGTYAVERYRSIAYRLIEILDERLSERRFLAGEDYSIADMATYPWAGYVDTYKLDWADYPHLKRWCDEIAARPATKRQEEIRSKLAFDEKDSLQAASKADLDRFWWRSSAPA
jgi:GST-like protein